MDWRIKGVIQKVLSTVPGGVRVNDLLQRTLGELRHFDQSVADKVEDWVIHMGHMQTLSLPVTGKRVFEIGTGWFPTLPICYALAGAGSCVTVDLHRHLDERLTFRMLRALGAHIDQVAEAADLAPAEIRRRHDELMGARDLDELLRRARIEYHAPSDATRTRLPEGEVDIVLSNSVLEHVPFEVIEAMMRESLRILRPGGIITHSVNCGDHYAYFDRRINFMNYLQFTEAEWRLWNNDLQYQNRLRPQHFVDITEAAGFELLICKYTPRPELLAALSSMRIAPEFAHYPPEQLATKSIDIVARKPAAA